MKVGVQCFPVGHCTVVLMLRLTDGLENFWVPDKLVHSDSWDTERCFTCVGPQSSDVWQGAHRQNPSRQPICRLFLDVKVRVSCLYVGHTWWFWVCLVNRPSSVIPSLRITQVSALLSNVMPLEWTSLSSYAWMRERHVRIQQRVSWSQGSIVDAD